MTVVTEAPRLTKEQEAECRLAERRCIISKPSGYGHAKCGSRASFCEEDADRALAHRHAHLRCHYHGWVGFQSTESSKL